MGVCTNGLRPLATGRTGGSSGADCGGAQPGSFGPRTERHPAGRRAARVAPTGVAHRLSEGCSALRLVVRRSRGRTLAGVGSAPVCHAHQVEPFTDQTALVTGAASGIGAALTRRLRALGAAVITTDIEGDVDHHLDVADLNAFGALIAETGVPELPVRECGDLDGRPDPRTHPRPLGSGDRREPRRRGQRRARRLPRHGRAWLWPYRGHVIGCRTGSPSLRHGVCRNEARGGGARAWPSARSRPARCSCGRAVPRSGRDAGARSPAS